MARETKVGLIVGLAFIICFAVILANRGQPAGLRSPSSYRLDGGVQVERRPGPAADPTAQSYPAVVGAVGDRSMPGHPAQSPAPAAISPSQTNVPHGFRETPTNGGEVFLAYGTTAGDGAGVQPTPMDGLQSAGYFSGPHANHPGESMARTFHDSPSVSGLAGGNPFSAEDRQRALETRLRELDRGSQTSHPDGLPPGVAEFKRGAPPTLGNASPPVNRLMPTSDPPTSGRTYTVAAGDTLYKIAASQYGTKSTGVVHAIFEANRKVLPDQNRLKVGTVLTLPPIGGSATAPAAPTSQTIFISTADLSRIPPLTGKATKEAPTKLPPKDTKLVTGGASRTTQWYQVRKNDRYASIAREFLGDTARWREIYELNKDKFPHPGRIREGVRIKVPVVARSDGRTRT